VVNSEPRIGSLFSGYGGLDMAVRAALGGGRAVWHSDIKPASVALLKHRYPDVPNLGDLLDIDYSAAPPIDVLAASWPCQPHSAAGKRLGEKDPRALWPCVVRAIEATRPSVFFGENVARVTSNGELRRVIRSLTYIGYVGAWRCVRASDVGACHRRDRCFVVAVAADALGEAGRFTGHAEQGDGAGSTGIGSAEPGRRDHGAGLTLLPTPRESDGTKGGPGMRGSSGDLMLPSAVMQLLPTPTVNDSRGGRNATANRSPGMDHHHSGWTLSDIAHAERWGIYAEAIARHERVFGRPAPTPTQLSLKNGNPQLSARFVEWMQMLPEGWVTDVPGLVDSPRKSVRNAMLSLLGDGVVPAQGAFAFRFLFSHLERRLSSEVAA
jgi:DNA (cytosine-5)-methyltransferase 1